eukprot:gene16341-22265_t
MQDSWKLSSPNRRQSSPITATHISNSKIQSPSRRFSSPVLSSGGSRRSSAQYSDRFIPSRLSTNLEEALDIMDNKNNSIKDSPYSSDLAQENLFIMNNLLRSELLGEPLIEYSLSNRMDGVNKSPRKDSTSSNLFKYRNSQSSIGSIDSRHSSAGSELSLTASQTFAANSSPVGHRHTQNVKKPSRKISKTPFKILDAPALQDDYYLNLVDWSNSNVLSVALGSSVYLWSACTSKVTRLCDLGPDDSVSSIAWAVSGNQISVGTNSGKIQIWDSSSCKVIRELCGHDSRVGTMAWNSTLLASGSRDRNIYLQDIRIPSISNDMIGNSFHELFSNQINNTAASAATVSSNNITVDNEDNGAEGMDVIGPVGSVSSEAATIVDGESDTHRFIIPTSTLNINHNPPQRHSYPIGTHFNNSLHNLNNINNNNNNNNLNSSQTNNNVSTSSDPCVVRELCAHKQEVCGLKWSFDEKMLASGGNDNKLFVWESQQGRSTEPLCRFEDHTAAVKAVAWSPHQHGLIASGGGTADRHIRFWNANTGLALHKIDTGSQVCNLMWSKNVNEIVSTHGYSLNQIIVWKYPSMQKIATLTGHTLRVLYLAMSPDGQSIVTGAGDETLRFWNIFPGPRNRTGYRLGPSLLTPTGSDIR